MQTRRIQWDLDAWREYLFWQENDKKILKRINTLIKDIMRNPFDGIGKPEPLKDNLSGYWSRRIKEALIKSFQKPFSDGFSWL